MTKMQEFDYIVVGAGSAGCVLAARLSEDSHARVLLLEAGHAARGLLSRIPAASSKLLGGRLDWGFHTEPEPGLQGRRLYWPRGRALGGSSAINYMIYLRGQAQDYARWVASGALGWSPEDVLPYFWRLENGPSGSAAQYGHEGPMHVSGPRHLNRLTEQFIAAGVEMGLRCNADFNGESQEGIGVFRTNTHRGRRWSAADGYLRPALLRRNLEVHGGTRVSRVLFEGGRAVGVEYASKGQVVRVRARREVILSAGSLLSPQILMLSGIGPAQMLREHRISVRRDLPGVGSNLQDHLLAVAAFNCSIPITYDNAETLGNLARFLAAGSGPLTSNIAEAGAHIRVGARSTSPDVQLVFAPAYFLDHGRHRPGGHGFSVAASLMRPSSRGCVSLASADPSTYPRITARYLSDPVDLEVLSEGLRIACEFGRTRALSPYCSGGFFPEQALATPTARAEFIRRMAETHYHPVGTCAMGSGPQAVVDSELRVRGVDGLRVVDASIMPSITSGNPAAAVMMIAEKASDLIRAFPRKAVAAEVPA